MANCLHFLGPEVTISVWCVVCEAIKCGFLICQNHSAISTAKVNLSSLFGYTIYSFYSNSHLGLLSNIGIKCKLRMCQDTFYCLKVHFCN